MTDYKTLYDAIVNLNIPIKKQGKFANDKDLWFEYAHFPYIGKGNQSDVVDINTPLTFEAKTDGTVIRFCSYYTEEVQREIEVSFDDGDTWLPFKSYPSDNNQSIIAVLDTGKKILVRGDNPAMGYYSEKESAVVEGGGFYIVGEAYVYGNVMSLLNSKDFASMTSVPEYAFANLFCDATMNGEWNNSNSLFSHPTKKLLLPATILAKYCYNQMFSWCKSLTTAPELPATMLANSCYTFMFQNCDSLIVAPKLPATVLAANCYQSMFDSCISLTAAPELPASNLAEYCYEAMFSYCTSLTVAPELPATILKNGCYNSMFAGCESLTIAPGLPATILAERCYQFMFNGCSNLAAAPALPATTLANSCYIGMFSGCTNLTAAPGLPAITLANSCYQEMFLNCRSLNYIKAMFTTIPNNIYTANWVNGVSSTGTFVKNSAASWDVTGNNGIPTGWTVETA